MSTRDDFARALLARLGAPASDTNVEFLASWMAREGTSAQFNPLATTLRVPGSTALGGNPAGVQNYPDFAAGVDATARTLLSGYPRIVADLIRGDGAAAGREAAELGKWSGGGYSSIELGANAGANAPGATLLGFSPGSVLTGGAFDPFDLFGGAVSDVTQKAAEVLVAGLLNVVFVAAALALIGMGVHRLTGFSPVQVANKAGQVAQLAAVAA